MSNSPPGDLPPALDQPTTSEVPATRPPDDTRSFGALPVRLAEEELPEVPGYEVLSLLGEGGMGRVFEARHIAADRIVALKMILRAEHASAEEHDRFYREIRACARLQHLHIVQVYHVGEVQGLPYFSLEFCPGGSLRKQLDGTPWAVRRAVEMVKVLARAAHHAHQQGIIHRDLKPDNVLLAAGDVPKLSDFGLAKRLDEAGKTVSGAILGTPSYMPPEQAQGKITEVGPAADVYALGAILYELLTGRPPLKGESIADTLRQVISEEPVSPGRLRPGLARDLEAVCLKCLEKSPARRYPSSEALADDLDRFLDGRPTVARPLSVAGRLGKAIRRRPAVFALAGLAVVFVVVAVALLVYEERKTARAWKHERDLRQQLENSQYHQQIASAERDLVAGHLDRARDALDDCDPELRGWEWHFLRRSARHERLFTLQGRAATYSPHGGRPSPARLARPNRMRIRSWSAMPTRARSGCVSATIAAPSGVSPSATTGGWPPPAGFGSIARRARRSLAASCASGRRPTAARCSTAWIFRVR
jgi:hypothetical protein